MKSPSVCTMDRAASSAKRVSRPGTSATKSRSSTARSSRTPESVRGRFGNEGTHSFVLLKAVKGHFGNSEMAFYFLLLVFADLAADAVADCSTAAALHVRQVFASLSYFEFLRNRRLEKSNGLCETLS